MFVNECAVMSVLAGPLFWMISEGSVHSSLVIGLRGGRFARPVGFTAVGGDRPPDPSPPLMDPPQINQLVISSTMDLYSLSVPPLSAEVASV